MSDIAGDQRYSLAEFVRETGQKDRGEGTFELEGPRMLEVNLNGMAWTKMGSMVGYRGAIKFEREGVMEHGMASLLKRAVSGEGARLTKATGQGQLYLADAGKKISILQLNNEALFVNGNDVLAFEQSLKWDIKLMKKIAGVMSGGLFNMRFEGSGLLAITTHYDPLTLAVSPGKPVITDPNATVAWAGSLEPKFRTDISLKTLFGRGSGESFQMEFDGQGFVVIQPYEEVQYQNQSGS